MILNRKLARLRPFTLLIGVLVVFAFSARSGVESEPLKILFIGNSYTHMNDMPFIFEKMAEKGEKNVIVEKNTQGGASFRVHTDRKSLFKSIRKREWDYVIMQGYSREMTFDQDYLDTATIPFINQIQDSIYKHSPCANVLFYMTWGYQEGFLEREEINSFEKMAYKVRDGYKMIGDYYNLPVVPVGMVWKEVNEHSSINLYDPDKAHPSLNGSFLIASTFYISIFNEQIKDKYSYTIDQKTATYIKKKAFDYVQNTRDEYELNKNVFDVDYSFNGRGLASLKFTSSFPESESIIWDMGDGTEILEANGEHEYGEIGDRIVELKVYAECGVHNYQVAITPPTDKKKRKCRWRKKAADN